MRELISCIKNLPRHFLTALQSLWRNGVMSFSSIFAVMITLLLIGSISALALNVQEITLAIENEVRIYVKMDRNIDETAEQQIGEQIKEIANVAQATYSSKDEQLDKLIEGYDDGEQLFETYRNDNPLGAAYEVDVTDAQYIHDVSSKIGDIPNVAEVTYGGDATNTMLSTLKNVRNLGSICVVALSVVALFMIANTIKIAITSRQTEISIMRMVGASNWYIRIPFMLEGMLIGIIGSIIPIAAIVYGYNAIFSSTGGSVVTATMKLIAPMPFLGQLSLILVALGAGVGFIGSYVSIRKFLKY